MDLRQRGGIRGRGFAHVEIRHEPGCLQVLEQRSQPVRSFRMSGRHLVIQTLCVGKKQH